MPPILLSRSRKPVVRPETVPGWRNARSAPMDRVGQGALEGDEAARCCRRSAASWNSDCSANSICCGAVEFGVGAEGVVDDGLADIDQLAAQPGVVDGAAVVAGVDDADHGGQKLGQVGGAADFLQDAGVLEFRLQGDGVGELAGLDPARDGLVDPAVDRVGEMLRRRGIRETRS